MVYFNQTRKKYRIYCNRMRLYLLYLYHNKNKSIKIHIIVLREKSQINLTILKLWQ